MTFVPEPCPTSLKALAGPSLLLPCAGARTLTFGLEAPDVRRTRGPVVFRSTGRWGLALQKGPIKTPPWWKEHGVSGHLKMRNEESTLRVSSHRGENARRVWDFQRIP